MIVYTANSGTDTRDRVLAAGGHAVVGKSDPGELLVGTIHRLVGHDDEVARPVGDAFGDRMTELLHRPSPAGDEATARPTLLEHGIRPWFVVGAVALLPLLIAAVWFAAVAMGWVGR